MVHWLSILVIFIFSATGLAAETCGPYDNQYALTSLDQLQNRTCEEVKNSSECQHAYGKIKAEGGDPKDYELQCKDRGQVLRFLEQQVDMRVGCAIGGWNFIKDTFVSLGTAIGEGAAKMALENEKAREENAKCEKNPAMKKAYYTDYNASVPKLLQVELPKDEVFNRASCVTVQRTLMMVQQSQQIAAMDKVRTRYFDPNAKYSAEEQEYVDWVRRASSERVKGPDLMTLAKNKLNEMDVKYQCYNTVRASAMVCEAMASVATLAAGPVGAALKAAKAANIAKLAGVAVDAEKMVAATNVAKAATTAEKAAQSSAKVEDLVGKVKSAERRGTGGIGQALTNQAQKDEILSLSRDMTTRERVTAFESLAGRKLSTEEAAQLEKMHQVGTSQGRDYYFLTEEDLKLKLNYAAKTNPLTGKPYFNKNETDILMRNGLTGGSNEAQMMKDYQKYADLAAKNEYSQYQRLHAESSRALGKTQEAEAAYSRAYTAYTKEHKVDFSNPTAARQSLSRMTENELFQLEELSAITGNTQKLTEVTKAKWATIDKDVRSRFNGRQGASEMMEATVRHEYSELRTATQSSNPMTKKAAEAKLKALKEVYPGLP